MRLKASAPNFGQALRAVRLACDLSQEDFYEVSGRTYVSRLENGGADPSLSKVVQLAQLMDIHPLTLLTLSFCSKAVPAEVERVLARVREEIGSLDGLQLSVRRRRRPAR